MNLPSTQSNQSTHAVEPIAIIGMGCRFPGADTPGAFWNLLRTGTDICREIPAERWEIDAYYDSDPAALGKMYVRKGYFLDQIDQFDTQFFHLTPREVAALDPQQRLVLEVSWETLEQANLPPDTLVGSQTGLFISTFWDDYSAQRLYVANPQNIDRYTLLSNQRSMIGGRLAHFLNVHGPNVLIDTACSASLTAVHLACQSLRNGECDLALAGGVYLLVAPETTIAMCRLGALSADGRCKPFARAADGFGQGEGCGMVLLKRLSDAQADGDTILALIRGSAINHDGHSRTVTTPNGRAQEQLLRQAIRQAGVTPQHVQYVEAHGAGTELGDPIEAFAIAEIYCSERQASLAIGSVKSNIGHLNAAAGIAGLIKVVLALQHGEIPPTLHTHQLNSRIPWQKLGITVPTTLTPWQSNGRPRLAGVSSFGLSGSNAHLIVEESPSCFAQPDISRRDERTHHLLPLSGATISALQAQAVRYTDYLRQHPATPFADICHSAASGRQHFPHRLAIVATSSEDALQQLAAMPQIASPTPEGASTSRRSAKIAFLFTGQGSQYVGMGRELYETQPSFRAVIDRCDEVLRDALGRSLIELLYPVTIPTENDLLESHPCGQASNFAVECALADLWRSWGVQPDMVLGHSLGDFAAAYCAGVLSLEEGLRLVVERGRLMEEAAGSMVAVLASEERVLPFLADFADVTIGVINGPSSVVISGGHAHVALATAQLQQAGLKTRKLDIPMAAHSPLLDPVVERFEAAVRRVKLSSPTVAVVSSMSGQLVKEELTTPAYWRQHLRNTVRFGDGVQTLQEQGCTVFLEIGPKPTLLGMVEESHNKVTGQPLVRLPSLQEGRSDWQPMLTSLGTLYVQGAAIDWQGFDRGYQHHKVTLPTYPFQRQRYWADAVKTHPQTALRPLIDKMSQSPLLKEVLFEGEFSVNTLPFLADHLVYDAVVSPGACQVAMVLNAAALSLRQDHSLQVEEVVWPQALVIPVEGKRTVQTLFRPEAVNGRDPVYQVQLVSFAAQTVISSETNVVTHLTGRVMAASQPLVAALDLAALRQRCDQPVDVAAFYQHLADRQIRLGASFRWLRTLWRNQEQGDASAGGEAIGELCVPETLQTSGYLLHPGLLDACFQVAGATGGRAETQTALLPFALESFRLHQPVTGNRWWCHAVQVGQYQWNLQLFAEDGTLVATLTDFSVRPAPASAIQGQELWRDWLYTVAWEKQPLRPLVPLPQFAQSAVGQHWLIWADRRGVGVALADQLRRQGAKATLVFADEMADAGVWQEDNCTYHLHPTQAAAYQQLLAQVARETHLAGIVHLWSLDAPVTGQPDALQANDLAATTRLGCGTVLPLVQTLVLDGVQVAGLWLVTQHAQPVSTDDTLVGLTQATLWGMGKSIALEHPELSCACVDLDRCDDSDSAIHAAQQLLTEIINPRLQGGEEAQLAFRGGQRYVGRLVRSRQSAPAATQPVVIHKAASYLITGGMGGLGLEVAKWLAAQGAGHLLLLGRSQPSPTVQAQLDTLTAQGVTVSVVQADVSDPAQLQAALGVIDPAYPLRGIIHAAGQLDDGALLQQHWERFAQVFAAKVQGAWHLHELSKTHLLDFFVFFSSVSSLLGNAGQANYAAANAFLDALAHFRQRQGLPALSINWGGWSKVGFFAQLSQRQQAQIRASGIGLITPEQGIQALAHLLQAAAHPPTDPQVGVMPIQWATFLSRTKPISPFYARLSQTIPTVDEKESARQTVKLEQQLAAAHDAQRKTLLLQAVHQMVAQVLRLPAAEQIDPHQGLTTQGLDSLMAMELRSHIHQQLPAIKLAITDFISASIATLATQIEEQYQQLYQSLSQPNSFGTATHLDAGKPAESQDDVEEFLV